MKREIAGIPVWIYAIGAAVVVGGYLWIKHSQSSQSSGSPAPAGTNTGKSTVHETITDWQGGPPSPPPAPKPKPKPKRHHRKAA